MTAQDVATAYSLLVTPNKKDIWPDFFERVGVPMTTVDGVADISGNGAEAMNRLYRIACVFDLAWAFRLHEENNDDVREVKASRVIKAVRANFKDRATMDDAWAIEYALALFAAHKRLLGMAAWSHVNHAVKEFDELA